MKFQLTLAARYLGGRKLRTFLTTLSIVIGVMIIFGMGIYLPSFMDAFNKSLLSASGQTDVMITHKTGEAFSDSLLNRLERVDGVTVIAGSLERPINLPPDFYGKDSAVSTLSLIGLDSTVAPNLHDYRVTQGRFLERGEERAVVISELLADETGLQVGQEFKLPTPSGVIKFTIVGLVPGRTLIGNEQVLMNLPEAQKLFEMSNRINVIEANLNTQDETQRAAIVAEIKAQVDNTYTFGGLTSGSEFAGAMQLGQVVFNMFGVLALAMGGFIIFNTFRTIVAERRHDIGMLRAIGASRKTIIGLVLTEGLVQGFIGTAIGLGLGYLLGVFITLGTNSIIKSMMNIEMTPVVQPSLVIVSVALGMGVTVFASVLPAWHASRVTPLEALRPSASHVMQGISLVSTIAGVVMIGAAIAGLLTGQFVFVALGGVLFLVGLVLVTPALVKPISQVFGALLALIFARQGTGELAQGNLTRQPSRSAITASATMIGLAIIVGYGGMMFSMVGTVMGLFDKSMGSDFLLIPPSVAVWKGDVGASATLKAKMYAIPGVDGVSSLRYAQSSLRPAAMPNGENDISISVLGIDPVEYPRLSALDFRDGDAGAAFTALASHERTTIINGILATTANVSVGDMIPLVTPTGIKEYRIVAVGSEVLSMKINTAYISQDSMKADFRKSEDILYQINMTADADPAAVESRLGGLVEDYPQFRLVAGHEYIAEFREQYNAIFFGFYVLLGVLAFPSLIAILNTLAIGVIERTREIGMLRAIGATRSQVWKTIVAEALLLALLGTAFGLLAGLYLSYVFVEGIGASGIFELAYVFPMGGMLAAIAVGLIFGVIAALLPARQAANMEIVKALRYE